MKSILGCTIVLVLILGCGGAKKTEQVISTNDDDTCDVLVSFFSPGNGIDRKALNEFLSLLKKDFPNVRYETFRWGREGEIDYCFELSDKEAVVKARLIDSVNEIAQSSTRVRLKENHKAHKGK